MIFNKIKNTITIISNKKTMISKQPELFMKRLLSPLLILTIANPLFAQTDWYTEEQPEGLLTLTGVFDDSGAAILFSCDDDLFSSGVIIMNEQDKEYGIIPTAITLTDAKKRNIHFTAPQVPSSESSYAFMSASSSLSFTLLHFVEHAPDNILTIKLKNRDIALSGEWKIQTASAGNAIRTFEEKCQPARTFSKN
ncbi:hypothetical protein C3432_19585 [Citrobacter amalonaticus]|uniref:Uncharacterized protein n=1 Tax=Citrobacter amalonaticus TaxID=35703 RepID=A0A2S4RXN0_CITAM|nr:hypothetical protein [Citrobacter amalonaticus]POT56180.1 hypothetical protein C3432_19585 [Citrobacter amalonaticus]POT74489.1 hypothetical protein C3436_17225 [Citrobacter amalonaticus]POU65288.1 hypothetical protein C3430_13965 [Citrobacter amalonaticus]POV04123.1 hypothetical protein C3424_18905 [Citrobacter amalonaticus]